MWKGYLERNTMNILSKLQDHRYWLAFFEYKRSGGHMSATDERALWQFIEKEEYVPVVEKICAGEPFPLPQMTILSKKDSAKKRVVYTMPSAENMVLKMMAWCLQEYDHLMAPGLYSFRRNIGVKKAIQDLISYPDINQMYSYKLDIHDYFNSVNVERLLPKLREILEGEDGTYQFLASLLREPRALRGEEIVEPGKGIMAGLPVSSFLANVYLMDMDWQMAKQGVTYARYSDDIIVFAREKSELEQYAGEIRQTLASYDLAINPKKCAWTAPGESWEYLGFAYCQGRVDISRVAKTKIMAKCRRKARAIYRWKVSQGKEDIHAIRAYIKYLDKKFFDNPVHNELTWCRWYLPIINTDETLRGLDHYIQQNIRYLTTGRHTKANYRLRYETMQELGYRSLVNAYYQGRK